MEEQAMRKFFENVTFQQLVGRSLIQRQNGEYADSIVEDHWRTFQEGWESAVEFHFFKQD